ncbi:MAG: hypothetical protein IJB27_05290 [Clostridia bacterium]|nr:hypothetical protein [Clostridia bacterium]
MRRGFFANLGYKLQQFMVGRYGQDEFSRFLSILSLILLGISLILQFFRIPYLHLIAYLPALGLILWSLARMMSRNILARQVERDRYVRFTGKIKTWFRLHRRKWRERKTHCYFKCPSCRAVIRVPKGKGEIDVGCPRCKARTKKKT